MAAPPVVDFDLIIAQKSSFFKILWKGKATDAIMMAKRIHKGD